MRRAAPRIAWVLLAAFACGGDAGESSSEASEASEASSESSSASGDTGNEALYDAYCTCMLFSCHDHYHDAWTEDEMVAREMCLEVAAGVPIADMPVEAGDFLECRIAWCQMSSSEDDPAVCPAAMGGAPCQ